MPTLKKSIPFRLISSTIPDNTVLDFELPVELEASEPPEARGLARDEVRLMVSYRSDNRVVHTQFRTIGDFLTAGDALIINTSGTMNAALNVTRDDGTKLELHLSTHLPADLWIVEVRSPGEKGTRPFYNARAGETLHLPDGASATLHVPYPGAREPGHPQGDAPTMHEQREPGHPQGDAPTMHERSSTDASGPIRLWIATLRLSSPLQEYLAQYGFPIRYSYVKQGWPNSYYQSVYATESGSAEMPSAGRAFTPELITQLVAKGVQIAPLILHTGVASLEKHEHPYEEYYRVPSETARIVNATRAAGKRVIAVGTTVVRALETVTDEQGMTHPGE